MKKREKIIIKMNELIINSAGKQGKHTPEVRGICYVEKNKKKYSRKKKHKKNDFF